MGAPADHEQCAAEARQLANHPKHEMSSLPGSMVVSQEKPTVTAPEFKPSAAVCPHGQRFYIYPDAERIAALRAQNEGPR